MQWLNDASIAFVYSQLEAGEASPCGPELASSRGGEVDALPEAILLIDPATAFWLTVESDPKDLEAAKKALRLHERELVLCPVTDNRDGSRADAGTHWTLLVCCLQQQGGGFRFTYYDSLAGGAHGGRNLSQAQALASRIAGKPAEVAVRSCPRQTNTFDCGVYVLLFSEIIVKAFLAARGGDGAGQAAPVWEEPLTRVTPKQVAEHRVSCFKRLNNAAAAQVGAAGGA